LFSLGWGDVADRLQKTPVVEPLDPVECGELDRLQRFPWSAPMDHLSFVKPVDGLGECVVVAVADAADGWLDASFGQAFGVFDRDILAAPDALLCVKRRLRPEVAPGALV
jgi:hypothetical protein